MEHHLNLIKNEVNTVEKRVFPRFPFTYLSFKGENCAEGHVFEVLDISETGMQLSLKNGDHSLTENSEINGAIHWKKAHLQAKCKVEWIKEERIGVSFLNSVDFAKSIKNFLGFKQVTSCMQPIHQTGLELDIPSNLKYWLRSDGPCEVFIWTHNGGELSKFEFILFNDFIEWTDGQGVRTGKVINKRDRDTPLANEDEFMVKMDGEVDGVKLDYAKDLLTHIGNHLLPSDIKSFLDRKISY